MKLLMAVGLIAGFFEQGALAQARGGGVRSVAPVRRPVAAPVRTASPVPAARPGVVGPGIVAPVYVVGYYPYFYGNGYATAPVSPEYGPTSEYYPDPSQYQTLGYGPQGDTSVIVNPNYAPEPAANPVLRVYSYDPQAGTAPQDQGAAAPAPPSVIFLIAMNDHTIYPAIAYWVEDDTLNYITQQGVHNRVSVNLVDRAFSTQLNKDRNIDFALPPAK